MNQGIREPSDKAIARVRSQWKQNDLRSKDDVQAFGRSLRELITDNERASVCNAASALLSDGFDALSVRNEISPDGVFFAAELMPHTWVVIDATPLPLPFNGPVLVDPTVQQFFDWDALVQASEPCPFEDVAVLSSDDSRWARYYGLRAPSMFDVPNENRDDLRIP